MPSLHFAHAAQPPIDIGEHVFPTSKYGLLAALLKERFGDSAFHPFEPVDDEDVARVHRGRYLEDLASAREAPWTLSSELPVTHEVIEGFRAAVGGSIAALRLALEHGIGFCIGGGFHHAFADHAEGFCYFHDMAIAVEKFRVEEGLEKVLFVDVDVHQGNGTAVIYADDPVTFSYSIHQENNYPVKQRSRLDRGLEDGVADDEYLTILERDLDRIDAEFEPDLLCYVAGVDPHRDDLLGGLALSDDGILRRDRLVLGRYAGRGIPAAVFLAGGYQPTPARTAHLHLQTALAAAELCSDGPESPSAEC